MALDVRGPAAPSIATPLKVRHRARGQALVEFALVLVPLMFILGGIVQFAFVLGGQIGVTNAVREAARNAAAIETYTAALATTNGHATYVQLTGGSGLLSRNVQAYQASQLVTSGSPITQVCYVTYTDPAGMTQVKVRVEAYYKHRLFVPIVAAVLDRLDGVSDGMLQVGASEEIRVENAPTNTPSLSGSPQCVAS
jgi:Flp pilus assembly protein TadG